MKKFKLAGAVFILLSVVLGAFASHLLKNYLEVDQLTSLETGIRYMMYHGLALLIISNFKMANNTWIFRLFFWGTILFSLSIFLLSTQKLFSMDLKWLGPVTPIGGTLLIIGWVLFVFKILKDKA